MDTYFGQMYVHDLISGHGAFGFQTAKAISKVVREFSIKNCIFPFECQDWICGAMTEIDYIDRKISVEFWQNGLRAYGSLSLYLTQKNPLYKANQPTKIKAINQSWSTFFLDIGYESHVDIMKNHRFDHAKICVQRKSVPKKIVYLAGISEDQTERDLKLLTENFQEYRLHVKFHPSHPEDFKAKFDVFHVYDLSSDSYTVLFYGNTAMVYEVDFPAHLMFYLNDVRVPNLDPLLACSLGKDTFLDLLSDGLQMSYIKQSIAKDTV